MGHIAHLRKQLNSINIYDYHNINWEKKKPIIYFTRIEWFFISKFRLYFLYLVIISPWKRVGTSKMNSLHQRMHCAKFGWNWPSGSGEEDFLNFVNVFLLFGNFPLWKRAGPSLEQMWIPFIHGWFVPSLVEIGPVVLEKMKMWKVYGNDNNDNNDDGKRTNYDQKSPLESSAQVS